MSDTIDSLPARITSQIKPVEECLEWTGYVGANGYGRTSYQGLNYTTHRLIYSMCKGAIPEGYVVDHTCFNRVCCNPNHLRAVSHVENNNSRQHQSAHAGVQKNSNRKQRPWIVSINHSLVTYRGGSYAVLDEAIVVADHIRELIKCLDASPPALLSDYATVRIEKIKTQLQNKAAMKVKEPHPEWVRGVLPQHLKKLVVVEGTCWVWHGARDKAGYGVAWGTRYSLPRTCMAHRLVYTIMVGDIPTKHVVDHLCYNKSCVNPEHLEAITVSENNKRRKPYKQKERTVRPLPSCTLEEVPEPSYYKGRWRAKAGAYELGYYKDKNEAKTLNILARHYLGALKLEDTELEKLKSTLSARALKHLTKLPDVHQVIRGQWSQVA